jgi:16S rRNA (guanine966-N2)-methyltransferase
MKGRITSIEVQRRLIKPLPVTAPLTALFTAPFVSKTGASILSMKKPSRPRNDRKPPQATSSDAARYNLRVIGGQYRSRKLQFADVEGLRPTSDRIRETLFNWLAPLIEGACCLDMFAGSGALGIEALSRGAGHVDFIETSRAAADAIGINLQALQCTNASLLRTEALKYLLAAPTSRYDIVFCDPPFQLSLLPQTLQALLAQDWLNTGALIYIEAARDDTIEPPPHWHWYRHQYAGNVQFGLLQRA